MSAPKYFNSREWGAVLSRAQVAYLDDLTRKVQGVEAGATADQTAAEIQAAYDSVVAIVSLADAQAGTSTTAYRWTPQRVAQAIAALATGGGSSGVASLDFGAFPGKSDTSLAVTGQTSIITGSSVIAKIRPTATADHSVDEHWTEEIDISAGNIVAGTGFTIYAKARNKRLYGLYSVAWQWR